MSTAISGSPQFAAQEELSTSDAQSLDRVVIGVAERKAAWTATTCEERIKLLNALIASLQESAEEWVTTSSDAKGHTADTPAVGEEWLVGPCLVARNLRLLRDSVSQIAKTGKPKLPSKPTKRPDGQVVVETFPTGIFDKLLFRDFKAEVWMDPSIHLDELASTMAVGYGKDANRADSLCLVLGAGNISSIGPMDAIYKLFVENQVVILKMNPVNEYLSESFEVAFAPLIQKGFMAIVNGGSATGKFLCEHELVDEIHITGSDKTHDAIVYGMGNDGKERKQNHEPVCQKRVTSELGNVSPVIVVPGKWTKSEMTFQAENVASMLAINAGFNCNSIRVLVTHAEWPQRNEFLDAISQAFDRIPTRRAYYPGAADRMQAFTNGRENVIQSTGNKSGDLTPGNLPWTIIRDVHSNDVHSNDVHSNDGHSNDGHSNDGNTIDDAAGNGGDMCFSTEAFCSLMAETGIRADSPTTYLKKAVEFVNHRVWGSLNAGIIASPSALKKDGLAQGLDRAIADLEYGTVAINHWPGLNFGLCSTTWGAFPGHPPHDIQSGAGVVHNTCMFHRAQKTVLRGPFKAFPKPVWFSTHRRTHEIGKALFKFECSPSWLRLPSVLIHAIG